MIVRLRSLTLGVVLYYACLHSCIDISVNCETVKVPEGKVLDAAGTNGGDLENSSRAEKELTDFDPTTDTTDLTEEQRAARGIFGSRKHLRRNDAHRVAQYFLNGGPLAGHSHFVGASNPNCDTINDDRMNVVGMGNPNENYGIQPVNENNLNTNYINPVLGSPYSHPLYMIPSSVPVVASPYIHAYKPITGRLNPALSPSANKLHLPGASGLLGSILHPHPQPYVHGLHAIPHTLLRVATLPARGIVHAQSLLHNLITPGLPHPLLPQQNILGSTNTASQRSAGENDPASSTCVNKQYSPTVGSPIPTTSNTADQTRSSATSVPKMESQTQESQSSILGSPQTYAYPSSPLNLYHPQPSGYIVRVVPHHPQPAVPNQVVGSPRNQQSYCTENNSPTSDAQNPTESQQAETSSNDDKTTSDANEKEQSEGNAENEKNVTKRENKIQNQATAVIKGTSKKSVSIKKT